MTFDATTILDLILLWTWTCVSSTPENQKNPLYDMFSTSLDVFFKIAVSTTLVFADGLLETVQASTPPTLEYFKTLSSNVKKLWVVYLFTLEKADCLPLIYIGSATDSQRGATTRFRQYEKGELLPHYVEKALKDGYKITHKGILCSTNIPSAALQPTIRLLFVALEALFAYVFWAMRTPNGGNYGMSQFCPWNIATLPYGGLCSHCSLFEGVVGDFGLTAEELEAKAAAIKQRSAEKNNERSKAWMQNQMTTSAEAFREYNAARARELRSKDPAKQVAANAAYRVVAKEEKRFYCEPCRLSCRTDYDLQIHLKGKVHLQKVGKKARKNLQPSHALNLKNKTYFCKPCNLACKCASELASHNKTKRHLAKAKAA